MSWYFDDAFLLICEPRQCVKMPKGRKDTIIKYILECHSFYASIMIIVVYWLLWLLAPRTWLIDSVKYFRLKTVIWIWIRQQDIKKASYFKAQLIKCHWALKVKNTFVLYKAEFGSKSGFANKMIWEYWGKNAGI